jgi:NADH pyrophosphatase NudC (nudix superfamily)
MYCPNCGNICVEINDGGIKRDGCSKCNYINYKNPYPCISVLIVNKNNEVLLGKRHKDSIYPEKWCLPCGYMEYDESYEEAAIREVKEETGISIIPKGIINVVSNKLKNGINSLVVVLLAEYNGNEIIVPADDITEASFFDINKLPPLAFEADAFIINKYRKNSKIQIINLEGAAFCDLEK